MLSTILYFIVFFSLLYIIRVILKKELEQKMILISSYINKMKDEEKIKCLLMINSLENRKIKKLVKKCDKFIEKENRLTYRDFSLIFAEIYF